MTTTETLNAWCDVFETAVQVDRTVEQWDQHRADVCFAVADAYQSRASLLRKLAPPVGEAAFILALIATDLEHAADTRLRAQIISEGLPQSHAFKRLDDRDQRRRDHLATFKRS